jgi:hypothetical protein
MAHRSSLVSDGSKGCIKLVSCVDLTRGIAFKTRLDRTGTRESGAGDQTRLGGANGGGKQAVVTPAGR